MQQNPLSGDSCVTVHLNPLQCSDIHYSVAVYDTGHYSAIRQNRSVPVAVLCVFVAILCLPVRVPVWGPGGIEQTLETRR